MMDRLIEVAADLAAVAGILICLVAGVTRLTGHFYFQGYPLMTLFMGGMSLMLAACLGKLHVLGRSG